MTGLLQFISTAKEIFSAFKNTFIHFTSVNGFSCKSRSAFLIVRPNERLNYNAILKNLTSTDVTIHLFTSAL